ncbi:MAG: hypothetical protein ACP5O0_10965 [Acidimicrobiales bacterium]
MANVKRGSGNSQRELLLDLRRMRRRRRLGDLDVVVSIYRVYLTAILGGGAAWVLATVVGGHRESSLALRTVIAHGPEVVGLVLASIIVIGLRSGGRGGPLVLDAADVRHVLLAPIDRTIALQGPALRQVRYAALVSGIVGGFAGVLASRRLGGGWPTWALLGALVSIAVVLASLGSAMLVSGARWRQGWVRLAMVGLLGWSLVDLVLGRVTSPMSLLGEVALWPLRFSWIGLLGLALCGGLSVAGLRVVGGTSLESSVRRAGLAGQVRFAVTTRDFRTAVLLRRQLAQEHERQHPWFVVGWRSSRAAKRELESLRSWSTPQGGKRSLVGALWRRGWQGLLRYPTVRIARIVLLGAIVGACIDGIWHGLTALLFVFGMAQFLIGLELSEPLAQTVDRQALQDLMPSPAGRIHLGVVLPSLCLMVLIDLFAVVTGFAVGGAQSVLLSVGVVILLPTALTGLGGAVMSTISGVPPAFRESDLFLPPEIASLRLYLRTLTPPAISTLGAIPVLLAAQVANHSGTSLASAVAFTGGVGTVVIVVGVVLWVLVRDSVRRAYAEMTQRSRMGVRS